MVKLTNRREAALRELDRYGYSGAMQSRLVADGFSTTLFVALMKLGLAEGINTSIGRAAWFITDAGRAALREHE